MTRRLTTLALFPLLAAPLFGAMQLEGTPHELSNYLSDIPETVAITGSAEKKISADRAVVHLKVTTEDKSMNDALAENLAIRKTITKQLLAAGFPEERIQAAQFSSTPESGLFTDKIRSYKVENSMKATATTEAEFSAIAALIDAHKEVSYGKTEFELSNKKEIERTILAEACRDAAAKKKMYQTELSVLLTPVRFHDGHIALQQPRQKSARAMTEKMSFSTMDTLSIAPPAQFDELQFNATVTVEYRLTAQ